MSDAGPIDRTADIVAIHQLLARYNLAGDRLRLAELAATFMPDGVLDTGRRVLTGRAEIIAGLGDAGDDDGGTEARVQLTFVRHHLTTCHIDLIAAEHATGRGYFHVYTDIGPDHAGVYIDRFRKAEGVWLIEHRRVLIDWLAPGSLFAGVRSAHEGRRAARNAAGPR